MFLTSALKKITAGEDLSAAETQSAFDEIFEGKTHEEDIATLLLGLSKKGETAEELRGAAASMRAHMVAVKAPPGAIDIVGTGGGALRDTPNISTAAALVVAGCGVPVAKHGNRAVSSLSGSSDVLTALGINLNADAAMLERCLAEANCVFLHAPNHHPAMRHVAEVRRKLGVKTIFNLLGPLTNPANVKRHLIGVYDLEWLGPMAETLMALGSEAAWLAHGHDGMDEITTTDASDIVELRSDGLRHFTIEPEHAGLLRARPEELKGGDAKANAETIHAFLRGEENAYRDIVLLNAAAALIVAGKAQDLRQGVTRAAESVDSGKASEVLKKLKQQTG